MRQMKWIKYMQGMKYIQWMKKSAINKINTEVDKALTGQYALYRIQNEMPCSSINFYFHIWYKFEQMHPKPKSVGKLLGKLPKIKDSSDFRHFSQLSGKSANHQNWPTGTFPSKTALFLHPLTTKQLSQIVFSGFLRWS